MGKMKKQINNLEERLIAERMNIESSKGGQVSNKKKDDESNVSS
jgi:hypothetical protein